MWVGGVEPIANDPSLGRVGEERPSEDDVGGGGGMDALDGDGASEQCVRRGP